MSNTLYYLAWLAAGLALAAIASAAITRHLRLRATRQLRAAQLVAAIENYTGWIAAQRHAAYFQGDGQQGVSSVHEVRALQRDWFPELSEECAQLLEVHARLIDFLWAQQVLRLNDPDAWFESDHDTRFMQLWRSHREAAQAVAQGVGALAGALDAGMAESTFPA